MGFFYEELEKKYFSGLLSYMEPCKKYSYFFSYLFCENIMSIVHIWFPYYREKTYNIAVRAVNQRFVWLLMELLHVTIETVPFR